MNCVPLIMPRPSFERRRSGLILSAACTALAVTRLAFHWTLPSPSTGSVRCASGARSPDAPSEPFSYTMGWTRSFAKRIKRSTSSGVTPEKPLASPLTLRINIRRTSSAGISSPTPTAWLRIRFSCSCSIFDGAMRVSARMPKPVLMP